MHTAQRNVVIVIQPVNGFNLPTNVELLDVVVKVFNSGMVLVAAKDQLGFTRSANKTY